MPMKELYQMLYEDPARNYGVAAKNRCPGVRSFPLYSNYLESPVIDLGCGSGDTVARIREAGYDADGIDQIELNNGMKSGDATKFDCSGYGTALCIDVFEHLEPEELTSLLENMAKANRQIIQIHCGPSTEKGYSQELHINIKTPEEWDELLSKYFNIQYRHRSGQRVMYFCGDEEVAIDRFEIPKHFNMRIFWNPDGSFYIPRRHRSLERYLDAHCIKVQDRMYFPPIVGSHLVTELAGKHKGQTAYIVGKGPSLDLLTAGYFEHDGPVICINDAIKYLPDLDRPKYMVQCDRTYKEECRTADEDVTLILHYRTKGLYPNYKNKYYFHQKQFDPSMSGPGGAVAVEVAKMLGCTHIVMLCFDACVNKKIAYAKCVGYQSSAFGMDPNRFLSHRGRIDRQFKGTSHEWIIPGCQSSHDQASSDIPQQLSDNPAEHHEPAHTEHPSSSQATLEQPLKRGRVHQTMIVDRLEIEQQS